MCVCMGNKDKVRQCELWIIIGNFKKIGVKHREVWYTLKGRRDY